MDHSSEPHSLKESPLSADSGCETSPPALNFLEDANAGRERDLPVHANANGSDANPSEENAGDLQNSVSCITPRDESSTDYRKEYREDEQNTGNLNASYCQSTEIRAPSPNEQFVHSFSTFLYPYTYYLSSDSTFYYPGQPTSNEFSNFSGTVIPNSHAVSVTFESPSSMIYGQAGDPNLNNYFQWTQLQHLNTDASTVIPRFPVYACTAYPSADASNNNNSTSNCYDVARQTLPIELPSASAINSNCEVQGKSFPTDPQHAPNPACNSMDYYQNLNVHKPSSPQDDTAQASTSKNKAMMHVQRRYSVPNHRVYFRPPLSPPSHEGRRRWVSNAQSQTASADADDSNARTSGSRRHSVPLDRTWFQKNMYLDGCGHSSEFPRTSAVGQETRRTMFDPSVGSHRPFSDEKARSAELPNLLSSLKHGGNMRFKGVMKQYNFYQRLDLPHDCLGKPLLLSSDPRSPRSVETLWREHMALLFRNLRETWLINRAPNGFQPSKSWLVSKDLAKVRFYCKSCCDGWTSMHGVVVFYFRRNVLSSRSQSPERSSSEVRNGTQHRPYCPDEGITPDGPCSRNVRHVDNVETDDELLHCATDHQTNANGHNMQKNTEDIEAKRIKYPDFNNNNNFDAPENGSHKNFDHFLDADSKLGSRLKTANLGSWCPRRRDGLRGWGEVLYEVAGQKCSRCSPQTFEMPIWYADEAQKVITNLYYAVAQRLYGLCTPSPIRTRRLGQPSFHHHAGLCQGCITGLCKTELCSAGASAHCRLTNAPGGQSQLRPPTGTCHEAFWSSKNDRFPRNSVGNGGNYAPRDARSFASNYPKFPTGVFQSQEVKNHQQSTPEWNGEGSHVNRAALRNNEGDRATYMARFPDQNHQHSQNSQDNNVSTGGIPSTSFGLPPPSNGNKTHDVNKLTSSYSAVALQQFLTTSNVNNGQPACYQTFPLSRPNGNVYSPYPVIPSSAETYQSAHPTDFLPSAFPTLMGASQSPAHASSQAEQLMPLQTTVPPLVPQAVGLQNLSLPHSSGLASQNPGNGYQFSPTCAPAQGESIFLPCPNFATIPYVPPSLNSYPF